jgi:hypothetical protein
MSVNSRFEKRFFARFAGAILFSMIAAMVAFSSSLLPAATPKGSSARPPQPRDANAIGEPVDLFDVIDAGQVDVKFIPKDSTQAQVLISNRTKKPLSVRLPETFAGLPVLKQVGGGGGGGQSVGGGFGAGGGGGGFFNVPAEKTGKLKVACVCLEHGKAEPRPAMAYEIRPIREANENPAVAELCKLLGAGRVDQRAAQAAAWHLASGMSWQELAAKELIYADGRREPYFASHELLLAAKAVETAHSQAQGLSDKSMAKGEMKSQ